MIKQTPETQQDVGLMEWEEHGVCWQKWGPGGGLLRLSLIQAFSNLQINFKSLTRCFLALTGNMCYSSEGGKRMVLVVANTANAAEWEHRCLSLTEGRGEKKSCGWKEQFKGTVKHHHHPFSFCGRWIGWKYNFTPQWAKDRFLCVCGEENKTSCWGGDMCPHTHTHRLHN